MRGWLEYLDWVNDIMKKGNGYVWKLSTHSVTPLQGGNNAGDRTFLESHALSLLPLSPFLDTPKWERRKMEGGRKREVDDREWTWGRWMYEEDEWMDARSDIEETECMRNNSAHLGLRSWGEEGHGVRGWCCCMSHYKFQYSRAGKFKLKNGKHDEEETDIAEHEEKTIEEHTTIIWRRPRR
jgi:hypothetical protein